MALTETAKAHRTIKMVTPSIARFTMWLADSGITEQRRADLERLLKRDQDRLAKANAVIGKEVQ